MTRTRSSSANHGSKIRYAVVGLGHISQEAVLPAFQHARRNSVLVGLVSGDPLKLKRLSRKHRVPRTWTYAQYSDCLQSGAIDAVYIALPNSMHCEYAVRAANAGIHILCEKPLAVSEEECVQMIAAADANDVRLMTAYRLHFERANRQALEIVSSGKIGEPLLFESTFTMQVKDPGNIRLKKALGGGTLYDIGIYCINAARHLFQAEPIEVVALSANGMDPRFAEVEGTASAILRFPNERLATFTCSFGASEVSAYRVVGTKGNLLVDPAYHYSKRLSHTLTVNGRTRTRAFPERDQFAPELLHFSDCVREGREPGPSGREGLADVRIIRAVYKSAERRGELIELDAIEPALRPRQMREMRGPRALEAARPREHTRLRDV